MVKVTHLEKELEERLKEFKDTYVEMLTLTIDGLNIAIDLLKGSNSRDLPTVSATKDAFDSLCKLINSLQVGSDFLSSAEGSAFWIKWIYSDKKRYFRENFEEAKPLTEKLLVFELLHFLAAVHSEITKIKEINSNTILYTLPIENELNKIISAYVLD